jgi:phosphopantetheine--protein transferase-like protein
MSRSGVENGSPAPLSDAKTGVVVGLGTDLVEIERFRLAMKRRAKLGERLFSDEERAYAERHRDPAPRLAARFAAKEAVMKALGVGLGAFKLRDVEVARHRSGAPELVLRGKATALADRRGVTGWHLSLTHTDSMAMAVAIALG